MEDKSYCNCCVNRDTDKCENCYQTNTRRITRHANFSPNPQVRNYFHLVWTGQTLQEYMWNSTCDAPITKSVRIHNEHYCPYCANSMFPIQDSDTLRVTGYTCFCEGALAEVEYEQEKKKLLQKHEQELDELKEEYRSKLIAKLNTLFNIKQEADKKSFEFFNKDSTCVGFYENKTIDLDDLIF